MRNISLQTLEVFLDRKDISHLIGTPYEEKNCWDIAREFYSIEFGLELKHFVSDPEDRKATENLIYTNKSEFEKVTDTPRYGDIVLLRIRGIESHIGIYLGDGSFLHTLKQTGSVVDRIERWDKNITGYYRPKTGT